mgnify:CR=1 FL=1
MGENVSVRTPRWSPKAVSRNIGGASEFEPFTCASIHESYQLAYFHACIPFSTEAVCRSIDSSADAMAPRYRSICPTARLGPP